MDTIILRTTTEEVAAGDPFLAAAERKQKGCSWCFGGYITITTEEDGQERDEAVRCKRCEVKERS